LKREVNLPFCVIPQILYHGNLEESEGIVWPVLTSGLDESGWSASQPSRFTPWEIAPGTHWSGGGIGPRMGLNFMDKRKSNPSSLARSQFLSRQSFRDFFGDILK
jgi:hypothetical protein